ncbi:hypothetical protein RclHR1_07440009 [Rhizophagus clarus]|uniref:Uncharacterized protein n=1 Tax=Rhizophagus clarus TaxID=94130 RepID=A0A2Z6RX77_9GLOM|nr:hypothetical protein RclHR1_07440009 [Rhizophagus clarus]
MYKKTYKSNIEKPKKDSRTFYHEAEKNEKPVLLLEAQKIANQAYKDGIKEIYKLTVDTLKKNDSYEMDKYMTSLSHISNIVTTVAKHQQPQQPPPSPPPQMSHSIYQFNMKLKFINYLITY